MATLKKKISEYETEATVFVDGDLFDVSKCLSPGVYESQFYTWETLLGELGGSFISKTESDTKEGNLVFPTDGDRIFFQGDESMDLTLEAGAISLSNGVSADSYYWLGSDWVFNDYSSGGTLNVRMPANLSASAEYIYFPGASGTVFLDSGGIMLGDILFDNDIGIGWLDGNTVYLKYIESTSTLQLFNAEGPLFLYGDSDVDIQSNSGSVTITSEQIMNLNSNGGVRVYSPDGNIQVINDNISASTILAVDADNNIISSIDSSFLDATSSIQDQFNTLSGTFASYMPVAGGTFTGNTTYSNTKGIKWGASTFLRSDDGLYVVWDIADGIEINSVIGDINLNTGGVINLNGNQITSTGYLSLANDPTNSMHATTKGYVDNLFTGLVWKQKARVMSVTNITLSGTQTINTVALSVNDVVLVNGQTDAKENGLYNVKAGAWTRTTDADTGAEIFTAAVMVSGEDSIHPSTQWVNGNSSAITIGVSNITFNQIAGAGVYTNGTYLSLTGNAFDINFSSFSTTQITEGAKLFYTDARAQAAITGTPDRITVTAGVVDIASTYVGQNTITTLGTITTGTLGSGTKILLGSDATGDIYYNSGSGTLARLGAGTVNYVLTSGGAGVAPSWAAIPPGITGLTTGYFPYATASTTIGNSVMWTDGTLLSLNNGSATVANNLFYIKGIGTSTKYGIHIVDSANVDTFYVQDSGAAYIKSSLTIAGLTATQVPYITTGGLISGMSTVTFNGQRMVVNGSDTGGNLNVLNSATSSAYTMYIQGAGSTLSRVITNGTSAVSIANVGSSLNAAVSEMLSISNDGSGTITAGMGVNMSFGVKGKKRGFIEYVLSTVGAGTEDGQFNFVTLSGGSVVVPLVLSKNNATFAGNVTISSLTSGRIPIASTAGLLVDDSGLTFASNVLFVGTKARVYGAQAAVNNDVLAGCNYGGTENINIYSVGGGTYKVSVIYYDGTNYNSAVEVANVASGTSNLLLMKRGGNVGIALGAAVTPTGLLDIGAGVAASASLRIRAGVAPTSANIGDVWVSGTRTFNFNGNISLPTVGDGFLIKEGTNATMGTATLVGGTVVVNTTKVTANSRIFINVSTTGGTQGITSYTISAGTSFTVTSSSGTDTSTFNWIIFEPS